MCQWPAGSRAQQCTCGVPLESHFASTRRDGIKLNGDRSELRVLRSQIFHPCTNNTPANQTPLQPRPGKPNQREAHVNTYTQVLTSHAQWRLVAYPVLPPPHPALQLPWPGPPRLRATTLNQRCQTHNTRTWRACRLARTAGACGGRNGQFVVTHNAAAAPGGVVEGALGAVYRHRRHWRGGR